MHRPPITIYMCGEPLVLQSQSIECIRAVPAWVGIKAIDSGASVGGEHRTKSRKGKKNSKIKVPPVFPFIFDSQPYSLSERQCHWRSLGKRFRGSAFEMALLCHSGWDTQCLYTHYRSQECKCIVFAHRIQTTIAKEVKATTTCTFSIAFSFVFLS